MLKQEPSPGLLLTFQTSADYGERTALVNKIVGMGSRLSGLLPEFPDLECAVISPVSQTSCLMQIVWTPKHRHLVLDDIAIIQKELDKNGLDRNNYEMRRLSPVISAPAPVIAS